MKKLTLGVAIVVVGFALVPRLMQLGGHPWPETVHKPFNEWGDAWVLPPRPDGAYMLYLAYHKHDLGGRTDTHSMHVPLKLTIMDETAGEQLPLLRNWGYGEVTGSNDWKLEEVANVWLKEGHRYRVEMAPEQLRELAKYRHQLWVDLDVSEKMNWGERKNPNWRETRKARRSQKKELKWEPAEREKARAIKKAWEAEKARMKREREASSP